MLHRRKCSVSKGLLVIFIPVFLWLLAACTGVQQAEKAEVHYDAEATTPETTTDFEAQSQPEEQTPLEQAIAQLTEDYDKITLWDWAPYCTLSRTRGTRTGLLQDADGTRRIGDAPNTQVWIMLHDGSFLSDEPFDACIDFCGDPYGEVYCVRNGYGYRYSVSAQDGSFQLTEVAEPGTQSEELWGYRLNVYRWNTREPCYGICSADGTEIIAPIYEALDIPFPDRFLLYEGSASQGPIMGRCRLTDEAGHTLSTRFHWIDYSVFEDQYLGIAVCFGEHATYPCYDEDGQPMPQGYWLIDRDGNICSERFAKLSFGDGDELHAQSKDDALHVQYEDGTEAFLPISEFLLPWESAT